MAQEPAQVAARRVTLITGASGGIGADLARVFARAGHDLALVARSGDKLAALADEIEASGRPRPLLLPLDLTAAGAVEALAAGLEAAKATPDILVNNAGFGLIGEAAQLNAAEQLAIVDLNVRSLVEITLRFLPQIRTARGKILNVASIVAFFPGGPGMAVYYASKAYVLSFTEALHQEWSDRGIKVSALCPGPVPTEFQARAKMELPSAAKMIELPPERVAQIGYDGLMRGQRVVVAGLGNKLAVSFMQFTPHALLLRAVDQRTGAAKTN